jgi:hypothetical protein
MTIKWKRGNYLNPKIILGKINSLKFVSDNDVVSFSGGIEIEFSLSALETMIEFPCEIDGIDKHNLIFQAISIKETLTEAVVISRINELIKQQNAMRESVFHILSSISLSKQPQSKLINIEDCSIELLANNFPEKYLLARETILQDTPFSTNGSSNDYRKIIISIKAKSPSRAVTKALRYLDLQRALWCLLSNSAMQLIGNEWEPINKIRLGEIHTVHNGDGELTREEFWHEPNFVKAPLFNPWSNVRNFQEDNQHILIQLNKSKYSENLKDALLRYVRALDEQDQNNAVIKLWGAIESLTAPSGANGDLVTRRCSFLFKESNYHRQILEHLREYRNRSVHSGDKSEEAKKICFQLQHYFRRLMNFHFKGAEIFSTLEEANSFLDLPPCKEALLRKKELMELALKYIS